MTEFILNNFSEPVSLDLITVLINNAVALLCSLFIMFTYYITYQSTAYSKKFSISLGMITMITTIVMSVIGNNIALSLGMVGALSIIRFRTAVKDVRDASFIFWAIAIGISCGVSQYLVVAISSVILFFFLLALRQVKTDNNMLLVVNSELKSKNHVESIIKEYFKDSAKLVMENASTKNCEHVFSFKEQALAKAQKKYNDNIVTRLLKVEGVKNVNIVDQADDIGR